MKKKVFVIISLLLTLALLVACGGKGGAESSEGSEGSLIEKPESSAEAELSSAESSEAESSETSDEPWLDKENAVFAEEIRSENLVITEILGDCFYADCEYGSKAEYKIIGTISKDIWCIGDHVLVTFENSYSDEKANRVECELVNIEDEPTIVPEKPVIYLYPEVETDISVRLDFDGELTCTYPAYNGAWTVTASPDGTLTDSKGQSYSYLYWEGVSKAEWDMTSGFCVKGVDTALFLEEALAKLGLNRREANEFIVYWLPRLQENEYNVISFQAEAYTESARLDISPAPDTLIRVFMTYKASDSYVDIAPQELTAPERSGFVAVEWGGAEIR